MVVATKRKRLGIWKYVQQLRNSAMSSTSQGLYLEGSSHGRTSVGDSQATATASDDGRGDEDGVTAAGAMLMDADLGDTAQLDGELWGSLPEDLQDRILAWLPFPAFARACTVCKRYDSLNFSLGSFFLSQFFLGLLPTRILLFACSSSIMSVVVQTCRMCKALQFRKTQGSNPSNSLLLAFHNPCILN